MTFSNTFKGPIPSVKADVEAWVVNFQHKTEEKLFQRAKLAVLDEIDADADSEHSTGFVSASLSGSGYHNFDSVPGHERNDASHSYTVTVTRVAAPPTEAVPAGDDPDMQYTTLEERAKMEQSAVNSLPSSE